MKFKFSIKSFDEFVIEQHKNNFEGNTFFVKIDDYKGKKVSTYHITNEYVKTNNKETPLIWKWSPDKSNTMIVFASSLDFKAWFLLWLDNHPEVDQKKMIDVIAKEKYPIYYDGEQALLIINRVYTSFNKFCAMYELDGTREYIPQDLEILPMNLALAPAIPVERPFFGSV